MVMELERTANLGKQVELLEQGTAEMQAQLDILKETIRISLSFTYLSIPLILRRDH